MRNSPVKFVCMVIFFLFAAASLFKRITADESCPEKQPSENELKWSKIISSDTIEYKIKAAQKSLDQDITTAEEFSKGDYKRCRMHFTQLAVLFAVSGQFDKDISWKDQAPVGRDLFARVAANLKVSTKATFDEAKERKTDLDNIMAGEPIALKVKAEREIQWEKVCERAELMKLMRIALEEYLSKNATKKELFAEQRESLKREGEMIALIATIIAQPGMEDQGDGIYIAHAASLRRAAEAFGQAAERKDFDAAQAAVKLMGQSCSNCHEEFR